MLHTLRKDWDTDDIDILILIDFRIKDLNVHHFESFDARSYLMYCLNHIRRNPFYLSVHIWSYCAMLKRPFLASLLLLKIESHHLGISATSCQEVGRGNSTCGKLTKHLLSRHYFTILKMSFSYAYLCPDSFGFQMILVC